jgi:hypothetical protein
VHPAHTGGTIRRWIVDSVRPADRLVVGVLGLFDFFFAWRLLGAPPIIPGERLWAVMFVVAGFACLALEIRFLSRNLLALAGAATTVAYASRAVALLVSMQRGTASIGDERIQAGIAVWLTLAYVSGYIFIRVLRPLLEARRTGPV